MDSIHNDLNNNISFTESNMDGTNPINTTIMQDETGTLFLENESTNWASINDTDLMFEDLDPNDGIGDMALNIDKNNQILNISRNKESDDFGSLNYVEYLEDPLQTREISIIDLDLVDDELFGELILNWTSDGNIYVKRGGAVENFFVHVFPDGTVENATGSNVQHDNDGSMNLFGSFPGATNANVTHFAGNNVADGLNKSIAGTVTWSHFIVNYQVALDVGFPESQECEQCEDCQSVNPILGLNPTIFSALASGLGVLAIVGLISILAKKKK